MHWCMHAGVWAHTDGMGVHAGTQPCMDTQRDAEAHVHRHTGICRCMYTCKQAGTDAHTQRHRQARTLIRWCENNELKPNLDAWHLILSEPGDKMKITIGNEILLIVHVKKS